MKNIFLIYELTCVYGQMEQLIHSFASYSVFGKDMIWFLWHLLLFSNSIFPGLYIFEKRSEFYAKGCSET